MAKVIAPEGFSLELDSERMTFGHSTEVEVPLLPDLGVAERHFTIVRFGATHFIEHEADGSAATKVNGKEITKLPLEDGDEICAGDLILTFCTEDDSVTTAADETTSEKDEPIQAADRKPLFDAPAVEAAAPELPKAAPSSSSLPQAVPTAPTELPTAPTLPTTPATAPPKSGPDVSSLPSNEAIPSLPPPPAPAAATPPAATQPAPALPAATPPAATPPAAKELPSAPPAPAPSTALPTPAPPAPEPQTQAPVEVPADETSEPQTELKVKSEIPVVEAEPEPKKPGSDTQRINLASAISTALTPKLPKNDPSGAGPSNVENIEARADEQAPAAKPTPPPPPTASTAIPGPQPNIAAATPTIPASASPVLSSPAPTPIAPVPTSSSSAVTAPASAPAPPVAAPPVAPSKPVTEPPLLNPTPAPLPTEEPEPFLEKTSEPVTSKDQKQNLSKAIKPPKRKRVRKPLFPFLRVFVPGLLMLALIAGGGYYAWQNYFKPAEKKREFLYEDRASEAFPSAEVIAQDILRYLPADSEKAAYIDVRTAFNLWSATMNPDDIPMENPVDDFFFKSTGLGLASVEYICVGGDAATENFVGVIGFSSDLNPAELFSGIEQTGTRLVKVESIGEIPLRIMERDGREIELVLVDQRTVLVSSSGLMRTAVQSSQTNTIDYSPVTASLGKFISDGITFALTGTPQAMAIGPIFESFGCPATPALLSQIKGMTTVSVSVVATNDIDLSISFTADNAEQAATMVPAGSGWVAKAPQNVRDTFSQDFPDTPLPGALDRFLESAEWATARKVNKIRLSASRRDLAKIVEEMQALQPADDEADELIRREAQNFAGLFATGVSCGNPDLPKAGSVEKALEMLIEGVRGRDKFSTVEIRFPYEPSQAELTAIGRYLKWEDNKLLLIDEAGHKTPHPAIRSSAAKVDSRIPSDPNRRTAKRYAKVYATAQQAGAINSEEIPDVDTALEKLSHGVKGSGDFSDSLFQVNYIDAQERARAKKHLQLRNGRLDYVPSEETD